MKGFGNKLVRIEIESCSKGRLPGIQALGLARVLQNEERKLKGKVMFEP